MVSENEKYEGNQHDELFHCDPESERKYFKTAHVNHFVFKNKF